LKPRFCSAETASALADAGLRDRGERHARRAARQRAGLVLELVDDAAGELGADALARGRLAPAVAGGAGRVAVSSSSSAERIAERDLAADALTRWSAAEPVALGRLARSRAAHVVLG
jgi:hypothetical protein